MWLVEIIEADCDDTIDPDNWILRGLRDKTQSRMLRKHVCISHCHF